MKRIYPTPSEAAVLLYLNIYPSGKLDEILTSVNRGSTKYSPDEISGALKKLAANHRVKVVSGKGKDTVYRNSSRIDISMKAVGDKKKPVFNVKESSDSGLLRGLLKRKS